MRVGQPPDATVTFPAAHTEVGDVSVWDDGDEATVMVGEITHGHFNPYHSTLTEAEVARRVTDMVVDFLESLFADRVVLWCSENRRSGGWRVLHETPREAPTGLSGCVYVWSGPLPSKRPEEISANKGMNQSGR